MNPATAKADSASVMGRPKGLRPDPSRIAAVKDALYAEGKTVRAWADEHGETPAQVYKVLNGQRSCASGEAHRIAVKLGLKEGSVSERSVPSTAASSTTRCAGGANPARREHAEMAS